MQNEYPPEWAISLARSWVEGDRARALANFTWVNNITVGASNCRFAFDECHCLARHLALPFVAISMQGEDAETLRLLASTILRPNEPVYSLTPTHIADLIRRFAIVTEVRPEWQMLYTGDPGQLDPGEARWLLSDDFPAALALATHDEMMVFGPDTFERGLFSGIFVEDQLVAMGGTQTQLPGMIEIGSIITHPDFRKRGYATRVVSALIRHLRTKDHMVFLCLFQDNNRAYSLYESIGFQRINELRLLRWHLDFA